MNALTIKYLNECLIYTPDSGDLVWRSRPRHHFKTKAAFAAWGVKFAGKSAGSILKHSRLSHHKCLRLRICSRDYYAHRVAWALHYGEWPPEWMQIDHINGDSMDNRIENLRLVTNLENSRNQRRSKSNRSGVTGVHFESRVGKWAARITIDGRCHHIGYFDNLNEAKKSRREAEIANGYHKNHGRPQ